MTTFDDGLDFESRGQELKRAPGKGSHATSTNQRNALQEGVSLSILCEIFHKDKKDARKALQQCPVKELRNGWPVYDIGEAARFLVDPVVDVESYIKKLRPNDLPTYLQSEFWKAQNGRLKFLEDSGDLWRTQRVAEVLNDVAMVVRQRVVLVSDAVERQVGLNEAQRKLIQQMMDGLLADIQEKVNQAFADYDPSEDHDQVDVSVTATAFTDDE